MQTVASSISVYGLCDVCVCVCMRVMQVFSLTVLSALALNQVVTQELIEELVTARSEHSDADTDLILAEMKGKKEVQSFKQVREEEGGGGGGGGV